MTPSTPPKSSHMLICDDCEANTRRPAIDLALLVFCPRCCGRHGMFPGEHGTTRSYTEWTALAWSRTGQPGDQR